MKIIRFLAIVLLCLCCVYATAQDTRTVVGEFTYYGDDNTTPKMARSKALEGARLQALAKAFGTTVTQSVISDETVRSGEEDSYFRSLSETSVKGEWINDVGEPEYKVSYDDEGHIVMYCKIKGLARELTNKAAGFDAVLLRNGAELRNADTRFNSGDDMRLYFKAPQDGYVAVYLVDDSRMAYTLLPYTGSADGYVKVSHGREYMFFDAHRGDPVHGEVDEMRLETNKVTEHDRLYVLFSPNPFVKANDSYTGEQLPRSLPFNDFHKWLTRTRKNDPELGCHEIEVVINGKSNE